MSTKVSLKKLTIAQAETSLRNDDTELYLLNKSNPSGNINMVITSNNSKVSLQVPVTWIPFDASMFCPKKDVLSNPDFRRVVAKGFLEIIDSAEAAALIAGNSRAQTELNKLLDINSKQTDIADFNAPVDQQINAEPPKGADDINPFITNMVLRLSSDEQEEDLINELDSKEHTLSVADIQYLIANSVSANVKEWGATAIASR